MKLGFKHVFLCVIDLALAEANTLLAVRTIVPSQGAPV